MHKTPYSTLTTWSILSCVQVAMHSIVKIKVLLQLPGIFEYTQILNLPSWAKAHCSAETSRSSNTVCASITRLLL